MSTGAGAGADAPHLPIAPQLPSSSPRRHCDCDTRTGGEYLERRAALCLEWLMHVPLTLATARPKPRRLYRVQRSAALDRRCNERYPGSDTQDSPALGLNAGSIFPDGRYELRINKRNVERALDPENRVPTGLIALHADREKAGNDYKKYRAMGCEDVYIAHITTEHFIRGVITINMRPHGSTRDLRVGLPVLGTSSPRLVIFPAVAVMDIFKIQTKTCVKGLWFACDAIQAKHIVRRAAFKMKADWTAYGGPLRLSMNLEYLQTHHRRSMDDRGVFDEPPLPLATSSSFLSSTMDSLQTVRSADDGESPEKNIPEKKGEEMEIEGKRIRQGELSLGNVDGLSMGMSNEEVMMSLGNGSSGNYHGSRELDSPDSLRNTSYSPE